MTSLPGQASVQAWARLVRAQQLLLERVESDLKRAKLPPLRWYDVLLELDRAAPGGLRQYEIGDAVLLNKYNVSRLLDRLEKENLIERYICESDGRGAQVRITRQGRDLLKQIWSVYGAAITEHFTHFFNKAEMKQLETLLGRIPDVSR